MKSINIDDIRAPLGALSSFDRFILLTHAMASCYEGLYRIQMDVESLQPICNLPPERREDYLDDRWGCVMERLVKAWEALGAAKSIEDTKAQAGPVPCTPFDHVLETLLAGGDRARLLARFDDDRLHTTENLGRVIREELHCPKVAMEVVTSSTAKALRGGEALFESIVDQAESFFPLTRPTPEKVEGAKADLAKRSKVKLLMDLPQEQRGFTCFFIALHYGWRIRSTETQEGG